MIKSVKKTRALCVSTIFVLFLILGVIISLSGASIAFADDSYEGKYVGYGNLTIEELYNTTNTFQYVKNDESYGSDSYRQHVYYDISTRNPEVHVNTSAPQITVLTHGLGGNASHWSNINGQFAFLDDSLFAKIDKELLQDDADIYWAKMTGKEEFKLFDLKDGRNIAENSTYKEEVTVEKLTKVGKHIIIIFESRGRASDDYNNAVYEEFNYMLCRIIYDVAHLSGNALPKVNLIGHSRGGITNLQYALDHPEIVDSLFSMGTPYLGSNTAGSSIGGDISGYSNGRDDIIDSTIYEEYYNRWINSDSGKISDLYKNINVYALGGYSSFDYIFNLLEDSDLSDIFGEVSQSDLKKLRNCIHFFGKNQTRNIVKSHYSDYEEIVNLLLEDIEGWLLCDKDYNNDVAVDLGSQLGEKNNYNYCFETYKKRFTESTGKTARPDWYPVVHNLETRDTDFIDYIVRRLKVSNGKQGFLSSAINGGQIRIEGYLGLPTFTGDFEIPSTINGQTVVEIGNNAFVNFRFGGNRHVIIPDTVKKIGDNAFVGCDLEEIAIPESVKTIGKRAFINCSQLDTVSIGNGVNSIGEGAFGYCTGLTAINLQSNVSLKEIADDAFIGCTALTTVNLPDSVTKIGGYAFAGCGFSTFTVGSNITDIDSTAFMYCSDLTGFSVNGDNENYTAENGVLFDKNKENLIVYPTGKDDSSYTVPSCVRNIYPYAIYKNTNLVSLGLNQVERIGTCGVAYNSNLETIIGEMVIELREDSFIGTKWYEDNDDEFFSLGTTLLKYRGNAEEVDLSQYSFINALAFYDNESIKKVTFGNDLRVIFGFAFFQCPNLEKVYIANTNRMVSVGTGAFDGNSPDRIIYLPEVLYEEYADNELWEQYIDDVDFYYTDIVYHPNGGTIEGEYEGQVVYGGEFTDMPIPQRDHYEFMGWYDSEENGNGIGKQYLEGEIFCKFVEQIDLYARWDPVKYTITLMLDSGEKEDGSILYTIYDSIIYTVEDEVTLPIPMKEYHTFEGWYTTENFEPDSRVPNTLPVGTAQNITLYGNLPGNTYTVTYDLDGKEVPDFPLETTVVYGETYNFSVPTLKGYIFNGWRDESGRLVTTSTGKASLSGWDIGHDTVVKADWGQIEFKIKIVVDDDKQIKVFWVDEGNTIVDNKNNGGFFTYGAELPDPILLSLIFQQARRNLIEGRIFQYFTRDEENKYQLTSWKEVSIVLDDEGEYIVNIYAKYRLKNFTIVFSGDDIPSGAGSKYAGAFGSSIEYIDAPKRFGQTFSHWIVQDIPENERFTEYFPIGSKFGFSTMPDLTKDTEDDSNATIYLVPFYVPRKCTVTLKSDHGEFRKKDVTVTFGTFPNLPSLYETDWVFGGWFTPDGTMVMNDVEWQWEDLTLTAQWSPYYYFVELFCDEPQYYDRIYYAKFELPYTLPDIEMDGYQFGGWYTSEYYSNRVYQITTDTPGRLYALLLKIYTVSIYDGNELKTELEGTIYQIIKLPTYTKTGHNGCFKSGGDVYEFGRDFLVRGNERLDIVWTPKTYTVEIRGGDTYYELHATYGERLSADSAPSKKNCKLVGLYTMPNTYGTRYGHGVVKSYYDPYYKAYRYYWGIAGDAVWDRDGNTALYAIWETLSLKYEIDKTVIGGGSLGTLTPTIFGGRTTSITAPTHDGYKFKEWVYNNESYNTSKFEEKIDLVLSPITGNICIYNLDSNLNIIHGYINLYYTEDSHCIAEGSLITLADGSQVPVEELKGDEMLLVWNLFTGKFDTAPILFIDHDPAMMCRVINVTFSDGTTVKVVTEHGFWDFDLNKYVYFDENAAQYIGHWFNKQVIDEYGEFAYTRVQLVGVTVQEEYTSTWSPETYLHLCYYVNGMLTMPGGSTGLFGFFEVDPETMRYDQAAFERDIATYGLFTYEEFNELLPVPEYVFDAYGGQYLKVAIGKGILTMGRLEELADRYLVFFE